MNHRTVLPMLVLAAALTAPCQRVLAWGADGHHTVGTIAAQLIAGTNAATQVQAILGTVDLSDAAVWADCAKGVDPNHNFAYTAAGKYKECKIFETPTGEDEMSDFVRRNSSCVVKPGEEICNKQYHYTDVNIAQSQYKTTLVGARGDDIVGAISAAVHFLKGEPVPAPFAFKDKHEALLALTHYVGDVHQPLHVGAVYLNAKGKRVNPDTSGLDPATFTRGGNLLLLNSKNFHVNIWDSIPAALKQDKVNATWIAQAKALPATSGAVDGWSSSWASDTLVQAQSAFQGVTFGKVASKHWPVTVPAAYTSRMNSIKKKQLTAAGSHLAEVLKAIWP
jgi:hypothetical protein